MGSICQAVAHERVNLVVTCAEPAQLYPLAVLNFLGITVPPLDGHIAVGVGVDEHVKGAVAGELGQKGDGGGDLAEDGSDLVLDLLFRLFGLKFCGSGSGPWDGRVSRRGRGGGDWRDRKNKTVSVENTYPGATFSWSALLDALFDLEDFGFPMIWT